MDTINKELTRRDRNKLQNKQEILAAALSVFAEKGYQHASIQEIADRADFAMSTIYAVFEGKSDLYHQVSVDVGKRTGEIFDDIMAQGSDPYEKLIQFVRAKGQIMREFPEGCRMLEIEWYNQNLPGENGLPKDGIGEIYARFMKRIYSLFESGIREGIFVDSDPVLMGSMLDSTTNALMWLTQSKPDQYEYDASVETVIDLFFNPVLTVETNSK